MDASRPIGTQRLDDPAAAFRRLAKRLDLKPSHFATAGGVSWPTAKAWFTGTTTPTLAQLGAVIEGLRVKGHSVSIVDFLAPAKRRAA